VKKGPRIVIIVAVVAAVAGAGVFLLRGKLFPAAAKNGSGATTWTTYTASMDDLSVIVAVSGTVEPVTYTTVRPDSNLPTRKLVRLLVKEGDTVKPGQAVAEVDASGLDLDYASAKASHESAKVKLANLKAGATATELAQAESSLLSAKLDLQTQQANYDSTKTLYDKGLAAKGDLDAAERQLTLAKLKLETATSSYNDVKAGSAADVVQSQEAAVAQASNTLQKTKLILDAAVVRTPVGGLVTEIAVAVGDLVGPSTGLMTVADMGTMVLQAAVNENDIGQVKIGQAAVVTPSSYPDLQINGRVTAMDLKAKVSGNVSTFTVAIQVPNRDGKLLWGMNADAEITVMSVKNVLTLPTSAVKTSGTGTGTVTILDEGTPISWEVQLGATDGSKYELRGGLGEGDEVVVAKKASTATTTNAAATGNALRGVGGGPGGGVMFFEGRP
jgi:multidrug efflux pump subunit AcrA (membrane-fusion protein)